MTKNLFPLLVAVFFCAVTANAQIGGTIKGRVVDPQGAIIAGAALTLTSPELQGQKTAATDAEGNFVFLGLPPGAYRLEVKQTGFQPAAQSGISLRAGQTLTLDLSLSVSGVAQTVEVAARGGGAEVPIIDTTNPEQNFNVSGEFLNKLPLSMRQNWDSVWFLVPGVVTLGRTGPANNIDPQIHGASERANVYKFDGFEIGNSFTNQGWTTQFSTEVIQDVQIKTAGLDASTPIGEGGFINIITKSGGNQFHGSAGFNYQPRDFNWTNIPGGTTLDQKLIQPEGTIGGPIRKDKTWFFASYRRVYIDQGVPRTAAVLQSFTDNGFEIPKYDLLERNNRITAKLTHKLTDNHTFTFHYVNDNGLTLNSDSRDLGTQETTINIHSGGPTYIAGWTWSATPRLLIHAQYGFRAINGDVDMQGGNNPAINRYSTTTISGGNLAGQTLILQYGNRAGFASGSSGVRDHHEATADISYVKDGWLGQHTFQAGFQDKPRTRIQSDTVYPTSGLVFVDEIKRTAVNGSVTYQPFHRQTRNPTQFPGIVGTTQLLDFYLQDKWNPHPRVSLTLGVRFDRQSTRDGFNVERANTLGIDPRLGLAYRLTKSGNDVIRVSWGRIRDIIYNQAAPSIGSRTPEVKDEWDNNLDGTFETTRVNPSIGFTSPPTVLNQLVDPDLRAPFVQEFHVGYTRQLPGRFVLDVAYVNRDFKEVLGTLDTNIIYEGGLFRGYKNPDLNAITTTINLKNQHQRYQDLEVSLIRNIGGKLQAFASYTYQHQVEKGDFKYDDVTGYLNPREWFENTRVARPHILRLNGSYYLPWRFTVAMIFSLQSGAFGGALIKDLATTDPLVASHGPSTLTLSNGRVVNNPLFSTRRLVGPRSEGQLQLPTIPRLNLRFGKEFRFKEHQTVEVSADFVNITNDGTPLFFRNGTNVSLTTFGQFLSNTQSPRGAQLSARWRF